MDELEAGEHVGGGEFLRKLQGVGERLQCQPEFVAVLQPCVVEDVAVVAGGVENPRCALVGGVRRPVLVCSSSGKGGLSQQDKECSNHVTILEMFGLCGFQDRETRNARSAPEPEQNKPSPPRTDRAAGNRREAKRPRTDLR